MVQGIVAARNAQPYVQVLTENGIVAQFSMAEARQVAHDILTQCSRAEADAMLHKFFKEQGMPKEINAELMIQFRDFRAALDDEAVEHDHRINPDEQS
jgi:hypothetical protein